MVLATPTALVASIGNVALRGSLVKTGATVDPGHHELGTPDRRQRTQRLEKRREGRGICHLSGEIT
jgi:hypothetical protein